MNIKSRIIPAKPRSKELLYRYRYVGSSASIGGGGESSPGINAPTYWELITEDSEGNPLEEPYILTEYSAVSEKEIAAHGVGVGLPDGGGGGSSVQMEDYGATSISLTVDGLQRYIARSNHNHNIFALEGINPSIGFTEGYVLTWNATTLKLELRAPTGGGGISASWGVTNNNQSPLIVDGVSKIVSLSGHTHAISNITNLQSTLNNKVDKVTGKSLILDTEINRLSNVTNQDLTPYIKTTTVNTALNNKVDKVTGKSLILDTEILRLSSVVNQDISGKVDKVSGKSLILNTEITRLAGVTNQTKSSIGLGNVTNDKQATKTEFDAHTGNTTAHITSTERTNWNTAYTNNHTHNNKSNLDSINQNLSKVSNVQFNDIALQGILDTNKSLISFVDKFNDMFEIKGGAIQAKYSLYSLGEVAAYTTTSSGIDNIKLVGDLNANNFDINGVKNIDTKTLTGLANLSLTTKITVPTVSSTNGTFTNKVESNEVKIGKFTLKEDTSGRLGFYVNNVQKSYIDTNGTYTKM